MNKRTLIFQILSLFLIGILVTGGSYAFWSWTSNTNKNVVFNTAKELQEYIVYDEGDSKFVGDFQVSSSYTNGLHSTISLYKTSEAANVNLVATINMDVNSIGAEMKKSKALKWVVTVGTSSSITGVLAQGNFVGVNNNTTITLAPNIEVTTTETFYTIWIWLDENENPSDNLSGETLDTTVWTEITQVEGIENRFEITRINANYQDINATVVSSKSKVTNYAVTTSNTTPASWTNISTSDWSYVYNLNYTVSSTGTYYVWFKNANNEVTSASINVNTIDTTGPSCTWGSFNPTQIANNEISQITLTCTDNESDITINNLKVEDISLSNNYATITNISKSIVTNGYSYVITMKGTLNNGTVSLTLPANIIKNALGYGNSAVTSNNITVANRYLVTINAGHGVDSLSISGWTGTGTSTISSELTSGTAFDLSTINITYKDGYTGTEYSKTSGEGTLNNAIFTVGNGTASITISATGITTPTCNVTGGGQVIYGNSATVIANNTVSYDSNITLHYQFGYATSTTDALSNYSTVATSSNYTIAAMTFNDYTTRYYGAKVYATDGTLTSSTCTTGTGSARATLQFVNAKITFEPNDGTLNNSSYSPRYTKYGYTGTTSLYSSLTSTSTGTTPTASKTGLTFDGWWTLASGGEQVLTASRAFTGTAVTGYTTANSWAVLEDKTLYAHYVDNTPPTITVSATSANNGLTATITAGDAGSGLTGTYYYKLSTSSICNETTTTFLTSDNDSYTFTSAENGILYVCAKVIDNAGNAAYATATGVKALNVFLPSADYQIYSTESDTHIGTIATYNGEENGARNVVYADTCWQVFRTTSTNSLKVLYNGEANKIDDGNGNITYNCNTTRNSHVYWDNRTTEQLSGGTYYYGDGYTFDGTNFTLTNTTQVKWGSDTYSGLIGKYTCETTSASCATLYYVESYSSNSDAYTYRITNNTTYYDQLGYVPFNIKRNSLSDVGYMYNTRDEVKSISTMPTFSYSGSSGMGLSQNSISTGVYFADSYTYPATGTTNNYILDSPETAATIKANCVSGDYSCLVGKYTFNQTSDTYKNRTIRYVVAVNDTTYYYINMTGNNTISSYDTTFYVSSSLDGQGKLNNPTAVSKLTEWGTDYANYSGYYICTDGTSTCTPKHIVVASPHQFTYHNTDDIIYGNDIVYDSNLSKYKVVGIDDGNGGYTADSYKTFSDDEWGSNYNQINYAHYTCLNDTGLCDEYYYITYTNYTASNESGYKYYVTLTNGKKIEDVINETVVNNNINVEDSNMKKIIDIWYKDNILNKQDSDNELLSDYLDSDEIFCNNRSILNLGGWDPNGGLTTSYFQFISYSGTNATKLACNGTDGVERVLDEFTAFKDTNSDGVHDGLGNGKLIYPVGLATYGEINRLKTNGRKSSIDFWVGSPYGLVNIVARGRYVGATGGFSIYNVDGTYGARPSVSFDTDTSIIVSGTGSMADPWIVEHK